MRYLVIVRGYNEPNQNAPKEDIWVEATEYASEHEMRQAEKVYYDDFAEDYDEVDIEFVPLERVEDDWYKVEEYGKFNKEGSAMKRTLYTDDGKIVGESDKGKQSALWHAWLSDYSDDGNYGVYFFHEEKPDDRYDCPSEEEVLASFRHNDMADGFVEKSIERGEYYIERVYIC